MDVKSTQPMGEVAAALSPFGTSRQIADALGVTMAAVGNWRWTGRIPPQRVIELLELAEQSGLAVDREALIALGRAPNRQRRAGEPGRKAA